MLVRPNENTLLSRSPSQPGTVNLCQDGRDQKGETGSDTREPRGETGSDTREQRGETGSDTKERTEKRGRVTERLDNVRHKSSARTGENSGERGGRTHIRPNCSQETVGLNLNHIGLKYV